MGGGGTPYRLSVLTYGGGDECACELREKREEMGRVRIGTKWKRRESEREGEGRRALKEKCTACSRRHHFYTQTMPFGHCLFSAILS